MEHSEAEYDGRADVLSPAGISLLEAEAALARVLGSQAFRAGGRRRDLLTYLARETLAGHADRLKGFTIAIEVFGRDASFDSQSDPVVRLEAHRLRRDLDSYYAGEGAQDPARLAVPKGGYAVQFMRVPGSAEPSASQVLARTRFPNIGSRAKVLAGAAVTVIFLSAGLLWWDRGRAPTVELTAAGPAIIVLPFDSLGASANGKILAQGISQQLISELMRYSSLRVYSPDASFDEAANADPTELGRRLGVTYVVSGSIYIGETSLRLNVKLEDAQTGQVKWSDTFDRKLSTGDLLAVQDDIAAGIGAALGPAYGIILSDVERRVRTEGVPTMPSYSCVLQAYSYRRNFATELFGPAFDCLKAAIVRDPGYADAWALLGWLEMDAVRFDFVPVPDRDAALAHAVQTAQHAVALDEKSVRALQALAAIQYYAGQVDASEVTQRAALTLNPNDPDTLAQFGWRLAARGKWDEGIGYLERAIARSVDPPGWYFHLIAIHQYLEHDYDGMLISATRSSVEGSAISQALIAIAQGALGNLPAAQEALDRMAELEPQLASDPAGYFRSHQGIESTVGALVAGLRKAGLEPAASP